MGDPQYLLKIDDDWGTPMLRNLHMCVNAGTQRNYNMNWMDLQLTQIITEPKGLPNGQTKNHRGILGKESWDIFPMVKKWGFVYGSCLPKQLFQ